MVSTGSSGVQMPGDRQAYRLAWQPTWVGPVFAVLAVLTVPWGIYLAMRLPHRQVALHYDVAWGGFDIALALALAGTAWTAWRRSRWIPVAASLNATLLGVDGSTL